MLFGPSMAFFCGLHWRRNSITASNWFEFDGRVMSMITVAEFNEVTLVDLFTSGLALRTNGNIRSLLSFKVAALSVSLVPFAWSLLRSKLSPEKPMSRIENVLGIRFKNAGGLEQPNPVNRRTSNNDNS